MPRWIALCFASILVSTVSAAPVPKALLDREENERLWGHLQKGSSIELTEAVCRFLVYPESTIPFFASKLQTLTMTKKQVERAIGPGELNELLWNSEACAVHILDAIGTPDALAIIKDLATGTPTPPQRRWRRTC